MENRPNSYTSSFKTLQKGIWIGAALVAVYGGLVASGKVPSSSGIDMADTNLIKLHRYAYSQIAAPQLVLAGSSISAGCEFSRRDPRIVDLSQFGGSSSTGVLTVLGAPEHLPKVLVIETGITSRARPDRDTVNAIYHSFSGFLYQHFAFLKPEFRPYNVISSALNKRMGIDLEADSTNKDLQAKATARNIQGYGDPMTQDEKDGVGINVALLKSSIAELQQKGVRVVLLRVRAIPEIMATERMTYIYGTMAKEFPEDQYEWLDPFAGREVHTSDGIHYLEADKSYLTSAIQTLLPSRS